MATSPPNIVVVNGEAYWPTYFSRANVYAMRVEESGWVLREGELWALNRKQAVKVDGVLWRVGPVRIDLTQRAVLAAIARSRVPCVSPALSLLRSRDRLEQLTALINAGLPVIEFDAFVGERLLERSTRALPVVVKVGTHHGGGGKWLVRTAEELAALSDLLVVTQDYVTVEPYVEYVRDYRCLLVGSEHWTMERASETWRANVHPSRACLVKTPKRVLEITRQARDLLGADVIGADVLEGSDGSFTLLEVNDPPGLGGFPDDARYAIAELLSRKIASR